MDVHYSSKKWGSIAVAIVLIIHISLACLLFMLWLDTKPILPSPEAENMMNELKKDWAARIPPIIFYNATDDHPQPLAEELTHESGTPEVTKATHAPEQATDEQAEKNLLHANATATIDNFIESTPPAPLEEEKDTKEGQKIALEQLESVIQENKKLIKEQIKDQKITQVHKKQRPETKKQLSLADLAIMYQKNMKEIPVEHIFLQGAPDNLPPDKQISFEHYKSKLNKIIDDMHKIYSPELGSLPLGISIKLYAALGKDGNFKQLYIMSSTGYQKIDSCLMKIYKEAGDRFPPMPKGLEEELFQGAIVLHSTNRPGKTVWLPF